MIHLKTCPTCKSNEVEPLLFQSVTCDSDMDWFFAHNKDASKYSKNKMEKYFKGNISICNNCTLIFRASREENSEIDELYDLFSSMERRSYIETKSNGDWRYPEKRKSFLEHQELFAEELIKIISDFGLLKDINISILNIRMECGVLLHKLKSLGFTELYGVDYFQKNINYAQNKLGLKNIKTLTSNDFTNVFNKEKYDLILANHTFTHAYDPLILFRSLGNYLNDEGVIVSFNEAEHKEYWKKDSFTVGLNAFHKQYPTKNSIHNAFRLSGFLVEEVEHPTGRMFASVNNGIMSILRKNPGDQNISIINNDVNEVRSILLNWWQRHKKIKKRRLFLNRYRVYTIQGKFNAIKYYSSKVLRQIRHWLLSLMN